MRTERSPIMEDRPREYRCTMKAYEEATKKLSSRSVPREVPTEPSFSYCFILFFSFYLIYDRYDRAMPDVIIIAT